MLFVYFHIYIYIYIYIYMYAHTHAYVYNCILKRFNASTEQCFSSRIEYMNRLKNLN